MARTIEPTESDPPAAQQARNEVSVPASGTAPGSLVVRTAEDGAAADDPGLSAGLLSTALSLGFVLLLAYAALRVFKRFHSGAGNGAASAGHTPRVMRTVALGGRERLVVVRYKDRDYLLGVAPGAVTRLDADPVQPPRDAPAA